MIPLTTIQASVPNVPFFSQFLDIQSAVWRKQSCGVTSLAMVIDFYSPNAATANTLLKEGIALGAYDKNAGWKYAGLIQIAKKYGFEGASYDLGQKSMQSAFDEFKESLENGPVIASIHYQFKATSTIPHLVVIDGIKDGMIYYNDPAAKNGEKTISIADFQKGWKKRFIVIRPTNPASKSTAA